MAALDRVVHAYLLKRGLNEAAAALSSEVEKAGTATLTLSQYAESLSLQVDGATLLDRLRAFSACDGDPAAFDAAYVRVCRWIDGSLDGFRQELTPLLYPLFVHFFIMLVERGPGSIEVAREFFDRHQASHRVAFGEELDSLRLLVPDQLPFNATARLLRSNRFEVALSAEGFAMLIRFLREADLLLALDVLNRHVRVCVADGAGGRPAVVCAGDGLTAKPDGVAARVNASAVRWGVPDAAAYPAPEGPGPHHVGPAGLPAHVPVPPWVGAGGQPPAGQLPRLAGTTQASVSAADRGRQVDVGPGLAPSCCLVTFLNTKDSVTAARPSPDLKMMAGAFSDSTVKVWEMDPWSGRTPDQAQAVERERLIDHGARHMVLVGHSAPVYAVDWSPCSSFVLSGSGDGSARLWSAHHAACLVAYRDHSLPVWDVAFNPLGTYFATASADGTARLWATDHVHQLRIYAGHIGDVNTTRWHPNGNLLATGGQDKSVRLFDAQSGNTVRLMNDGHTGPVHALAFSRCGRFLASAGEDRAVVVWDLAMGRRLSTHLGHEKTVWSLDWSHGGKVLASGSADNTVRVWDTSSLANADPAKPVLAGDLPEEPSTQHLFRTYYTKYTPIINVSFTGTNLLMATGLFRLPQSHQTATRF